MSSKLEMSASIPSELDRCEEEWKEDDFEDLDPVRSGGESGANERVVISSSSREGEKLERGGRKKKERKEEEEEKRKGMPVREVVSHRQRSNESQKKNQTETRLVKKKNEKIKK